MKNVLYAGPYKDSNGYGYSSRRFLDCLATNPDINLSIRPLFFTRSSQITPISTDKYLEYEQNASVYYDYVIQHCYPDFFEYNNKFGKNIGITQIETSNIYKSGWIDKLNLMDEIWVGSFKSANTLANEGFIRESKIIPEPYNIDNFTNKQGDSFFSVKDNQPFIFYTIGQYTEKKNIKGIMLAFLLEFTKKDNVRLFIKTGDYNIDPKELENIISYDINQLKRAIRKNNDHCADIDIITGILKDIDIIRLHQSSDCYINAVKSDDGGPCAIEAKLANKIVINTSNIGSNTYINNRSGILIDSIPTNVFSTDISNYNIFTMNEQWFEPEIQSLRSAMRKAYNANQEEKDSMNNNFNKSIFDMHKISEILL